MWIEVRGSAREVVGRERLQLDERRDIQLRGRQLPRSTPSRSKLFIELDRTPTAAEFALRGDYDKAVVDGELRHHVKISVQPSPPMVVVEWDAGG